MVLERSWFGNILACSDFQKKKGAEKKGAAEDCGGVGGGFFWGGGLHKAGSETTCTCLPHGGTVVPWSDEVISYLKYLLLRQPGASLEK